MDVGRVLGIAISIIGIVALGIAYHASDVPMDQIFNTLSGRYTDAAIAYFVAGVATLIIGGSLVLVGIRR